MENKNAFIKMLERIGKMEDTFQKQMALVRRLCQDSATRQAYEEALRLEETSEKLVLLTRALPAYTGCPHAGREVRAVVERSVPVEIGFTAEGWFSVRLPCLLPKKAAGSAEYIRSFLYPAMRRFFAARPPVRYADCVLVYRHVYDRERPERQRRDHDNIEVNMVSDIVALYVLPDDGPGVCSHYYCSVAGAAERTEVYVVPETDFAMWLAMEKTMPEEGVRLYETREK